MNPLLLPAFSMGLFGSIHCVVMCGGASSALCAGSRPGRYTAAFNAGRVFGYAVLGLAAGAVGAWAVGHGLDPLRFAFRALATTIMLGVGLHLAGLPSFVRAIESAGAPVWRRVAPLARKLLPLRSPFHALAAGGLWALMPCGLLYAALALAASSYSAWDGATTMAAFATGTLPVMLGVGALIHRVAHGPLRRAVGIVMLAFGLWSIAALAGEAGVIPIAAAACHH